MYLNKELQENRTETLLVDLKYNLETAQTASALTSRRPAALDQPCVTDSSSVHTALGDGHE